MEREKYLIYTPWYAKKPAIYVSIGKSGFGFADVTDGDMMLAALHQAGTAVPARAG